MKNLFVFAIVAVALTIFSGCQKDETVSRLTDEAQPQAAVKPDVYAENGFLVFANSEQLSETLNLIESMSEEERRFWEGKNNFISQQSMFQDIVNAESQLDERIKIWMKRNLKM